MSIGLVGAGRMAQALARGIIKAGFVSADQVTASAHVQDQHHLRVFQEMGCRTVNSNAELIRQSELVVLAVKPGVVRPVLLDLAAELQPKRHLLVSVAMGVSLSSMEQLLPAGSRLLRVMPNTPCVVGAGASVLCAGTCATTADVARATDMFACVGTCENVPESYLDAVTALSGSGPAYIYLVMEALADGGVKMGLPRDLSLRLAAQTVLGAAKMVQEQTNGHPATLRDDVTSPGGCTSHALHVLEQGGARALFVSAVQAATKRATELGAQ